MSTTDRASTARRGAGVIQGLLQELHQTPLAASVGTHDVRFTASGGQDAVVVLLVVDPAGPSRAPATPDPLHRAVNGKLLEHQLDASPSQPSLSLERRSRRRLAFGRGCQ